MGGRGSKGRASTTNEPVMFSPLPLPEDTEPVPPESPQPPKQTEEPSEQEPGRQESLSREDTVRNAVRDAGASTRVGEWQRLSDLRAALPPDMTRGEVDAMLRQMSRDGEIELAPDPDRKNVRQADHDSALTIGRDSNNLVFWQPRDPAGAMQRVTDHGVRTATDTDLTAALHHPDTPSALYGEIRDEQKRRRAQPPPTPPEATP
jgi:hypothetical protein